MGHKFRSPHLYDLKYLTLNISDEPDQTLPRQVPKVETDSSIILTFNNIDIHDIKTECLNPFLTIFITTMSNIKPQNDINNYCEISLGHIY